MRPVWGFTHPWQKFDRGGTLTEPVNPNDPAIEYRPLDDLIGYSHIANIDAQVYPQVPLHGDFTALKENDYAAIDLLVGGTPCQSFRVGGLRKGLADDRWNLALEFIRLAEKSRARWVVWENVLACCPLTEDGHLEPSSEGWQNAGMGSPTGFLTLSISECHSAAGVCSLSDTRLDQLDLMANRWKGGFAVILTLGAIAGFVIDQIMHLFSPR